MRRSSSLVRDVDGSGAAFRVSGSSGAGRCE